MFDLVAGLWLGALVVTAVLLVLVLCAQRLVRALGSVRAARPTAADAPVGRRLAGVRRPDRGVSRAPSSALSGWTSQD